MDNNELPVWMKRKESEQENEATAPSHSIGSQNPNVKFRCIAIGDTGIRMAEKALTLYKDQIPFTRIEDSNQKELTLSIGQPEDQLLLYDSSNVPLEQIRKFTTLARICGRVIVCELCDNENMTNTASQVGADILLRVTSQEECTTVVSELLHMICTHDEINVDIDDFFSTFQGDDYVMMSCEESDDINGWLQAANQTAEHWKNATDVPDSYLLSLRSSEKNMDMMLIQKVSNIIMNDENVQERAICEVRAENELGDIARIVTFAGMKKARPERTDEPDIICNNATYQEKVIQLVRDYVTSAHKGGNIVPPEKIPQVFVAFRTGLNDIVGGNTK